MTEKDIKKLLAHPFFSGLTREGLAPVLTDEGCCAQDFEAGEVIHSPRSPKRRLGVLLTGRAVVNTNGATKNALLRFMNAGDLFGVANLFTDEPYVSVIRADKKCRVLFLTEAAVHALLEREPAFLHRYISFLSGRVCYLNQKIAYLTAGSAERRLALYLSAQKHAELTLQISLSALSELLDVGRASLYRALDRLVADGYIEKNGRSIRILDRDALTNAYL